MALTKPFAENGNKTTIPATTSDGSVSYDQGFGSLYALPPEEGGKFIERAQFNQLMYDTTSAVISNQNSINTLNGKVATLEGDISSGVVSLTGDQTIEGVKTFSSPPVSATNPTTNNQVANKSYVDTVGNTAVKLTGNQTINGTKTFNNNIVSPNITAMQNSINTINSNIQTNILSSQFAPVKLYNEKIVKTIGDEGDFSDLESAFKWSLGYRSKVEIHFNLVSDIEVTTNISLFSDTLIVINFQGFKIKGNPATGVASNIIRFYSTIVRLSRVNIEDITLAAAEGAYISTFGTINARRTVAKTGTYALFNAIQGSFINIYSFEEGVIDCGGFDGSIGLSASTGGTIARASATLNLQINNANGTNSYALHVIQGGTIVNTRYFKTTGSTNQTNITKNTLVEEGYIL